MLHGLRTTLRNYQLRQRLRGYREELAVLKSGNLTIKDLSEGLAEFWRKVRLTDLLDFTPVEAMNTRLVLHHKNLPQLTEYLENINVYIAEERDGLIETLAKASFAEPTTVVLDLYFADDKGRDINRHGLLRKLQSLMLCHQAYLEPQEGQYYYRQCERLYQEIITLTEYLVNLASEREGTSP